MILDLLAYISRSFYIFNQVRSRSIYSFSNLYIINLYTRNFYHLVNVLIFIDNKTDNYTKKKSYLYIASNLFLLLLKVLKNNTSYNLISK